MFKDTCRRDICGGFLMLGGGRFRRIRESVNDVTDANFEQALRLIPCFFHMLISLSHFNLDPVGSRSVTRHRLTPVLYLEQVPAQR